MIRCFFCRCPSQITPLLDMASVKQYPWLQACHAAWKWNLSVWWFFSASSPIELASDQWVLLTPAKSWSHFQCFSQTLPDFDAELLEFAAGQNCFFELDKLWQTQWYTNPNFTGLNVGFIIWTLTHAVSQLEASLYNSNILVRLSQQQPWRTWQRCHNFTLWNYPLHNFTLWNYLIQFHLVKLPYDFTLWNYITISHCEITFLDFGKITLTLTYNINLFELFAYFDSCRLRILKQNYFTIWNYRTIWQLV